MAGLVALALLAVLLAATPVGSRALGTLGGAEPLRDRVLLYGEAWTAFADRPLLGWGPGNFEVATTPHRSLELMRLFGPTFYYTNAHDLFVEAFVGTGVLGGGARRRLHRVHRDARHESSAPRPARRLGAPGRPRGVSRPGACLRRLRRG